MTTTSQPMRTRPPAPSEPPRSRPPMTFGRPRRRRVNGRAIGLAASIAVPVALTVGIGASVIHGYREHTRAAAEPANAAPTPPADQGEHAPTGPDVGTDGLTAPMVRAITRARSAASPNGITIDIVSGKRTAATQQQLFDKAVIKYGSPQEASRWVLSPDKSAHVTGEAVDIGPYAAAQWLEQNGVKFGLCRRYQNEYWHFELLAPAKGQACPALEPDASG
ncbi:MAG: M15 family metallopeptidase [Tetrasphaera sp.]